VSTIEDTGEISRIRERDVDAPLLIVVSVAFVAAGLWALLIADPARFPVERGRVVLTLATAAAISSAVLCAAYLLNRADLRRHVEIARRLDRLARSDSGPADSSDDVDRLTREAYRLGRRSRSAND